MKDTEIEIQANIENVEPLIEFLSGNAKFVGEKRQVDDYFSPAHRNFLATRPANEWLRLRDTDGQCSINYKKWYFEKDGRSYYADEFEIKIENIDKARKILNALDFKPIVTVEKIRKIWVYKDYEISVDAVEGLGDFVEIEYVGKGEKVDAKRITEGMVSFLKNLGCGKIRLNYQGYPFLLLFPEEAKYEGR